MTNRTEEERRDSEAFYRYLCDIEKSPFAALYFRNRAPANIADLLAGEIKQLGIAAEFSMLEHTGHKQGKESVAKIIRSIKRYLNWFCFLHTDPSLNYRSDGYCGVLLYFYTEFKKFAEQLAGTRKIIISKLINWWRFHDDNNGIFLALVYLAQHDSSHEEKKHIFESIRQATDDSCPIDKIESVIMYLDSERKLVLLSGGHVLTISNWGCFPVSFSHNINPDFFESDSWKEITRLLLAARRRNSENRDELSKAASEIADTTV